MIPSFLLHADVQQRFGLRCKRFVSKGNPHSIRSAQHDARTSCHRSTGVSSNDQPRNVYVERGSIAGQQIPQIRFRSRPEDRFDFGQFVVTEYQIASFVVPCWKCMNRLRNISDAPVLQCFVLKNYIFILEHFIFL